MKKKVAIFVLILILICIIGTEKINAVDITNVLNQPHSPPAEARTSIEEVGKHAFAVMQVIGVSVASVMLIAIAIKYMTSSPNDKAEVKKQIVPFVVGAVFLYAATIIVTIIKNFMESI